MKIDDKIEQAHDRAKKSDYGLLQLSPRKWAIIKNTGTVARGTEVGNLIYGYKQYKIVEGCDRLEIWKAQKILRAIDLDEYNPDL